MVNSVKALLQIQKNHPVKSILTHQLFVASSSADRVLCNDQNSDWQSDNRLFVFR